MRLLVDVMAAAFLLGTGVLAGVLFAVDLAVVPMLDVLPADRYVQVHQLLDRRFDPCMPRLSKVALGLGVLLVVFGAGLPAKVAFGFAVLSIVGVAVVSEVFNVRINRRIQAWDTARMPAEWVAVRARWAIWNRVRTIIALAAFVAALAAVLVPA